MNNNFPKLAMAQFSESITESFSGRDLVSMHNTNPEPFNQKELEQCVGQSFADILVDLNLGFSADSGSKQLRQTLVNNLYEVASMEDVVTHAGAQEAIFCAFNALLKAGDKVLVVAPVFDPLTQVPLNLGCQVNYVHLHAKNNWSLNLEEVEKEFSLGCKLFVINFPHNPTGVTLNHEELNKIVRLCKKHDVWLLSDEVFRGLEHQLELQLPAVADIYSKGISIGVISKAFAIPGIRVGWLVCRNKEFLEKVLDVKGYLSICNSQVDELLASVILQNTEKLRLRNLQIVLKNKKLLENLQSIVGHHVDVYIPNTGCCAFAVLSAQTIDSESLVMKVVEKSNFLLYPSVLFRTEVNAVRIGFGNLYFRRFIEKIGESA